MEIQPDNWRSSPVRRVASGSSLPGSSPATATGPGATRRCHRDQRRCRCRRSILTNDLEDEINLINLNVTGAVHLAKYVVRHVAKRGEGRILITSSIAAEMPAPFEAVYGASKAFLLSFAEALRNELKDTRITVTALQPGPTNTNFFARAGMEGTKVGADKKDSSADVTAEMQRKLSEPGPASKVKDRETNS